MKIKPFFYSFALILFFLGQMPESNALEGHEYQIAHPTCSNYYNPEILKVYPDLGKLLLGEWKKKNYQMGPWPANRKMFPGDYYLYFVKETEKKILYPKCIVKLKVYKAKGERRNPKADTLILDKTIQRQFPRISLKGTFRCRKAVRDLFIHIPYCQKSPLGPSPKK